MTDPDRGLSAAEVAEREARGQVNVVPRTHTRTVGQIVRANVFTRFNALLGAMLAIILVVGPIQDALFGFVLIANALIGIVQELRAKRTLDALTVLTAPKARVVRDGEVRELAVDHVVMDDVLDLAPGGQVVVDGTVLSSDGLELDESLLTGESDAVSKSPNDAALSGSFVSAGSGRMVATAVGADAYAVRLAQEARRFTLTRSELRDGVDQILRWVTIAIVPTAALLFVSQIRAHDSWREAVSGAVAGTVAMVPEGLVLLMNIAFAVAVVRLAKRNVLVQELPAVEGLARVDVLCIDKTGTLTEGKLSVIAVEPLDVEAPVAEALAAIAADDPHPNATMSAIRERFPAAPAGWSPTGSVPFSSARKWSAASFDGHGSWYVGGADVLLRGDDVGQALVQEATSDGRAGPGAGACRGDRPSSAELPADLRPAAVVTLRDSLRPEAERTLRYFEEQGVVVKVISGDDPRTVGAIASQLELPGAADAVDARILPEDQAGMAAALEGPSVFGRVTPQQKRAMVAALRSRGHVVAMTGDGVNDALALKEADMGVAMGSGSDATRAVAQVVLLRLELRRAAARGGGGSARARQHRTHVRPVPHEDRLRHAAVPGGGRGGVRVPVPAEASHVDRRGDDRDPVVLPGARAEHRAVPTRVRGACGAVRRAGGHARGDRHVPGVHAGQGSGRRDPGASANDRRHGAHVDRAAGAVDHRGAARPRAPGPDLVDGRPVPAGAHAPGHAGVLRVGAARRHPVAGRIRHRGDRVVVRAAVRSGGSADRTASSQQTSLTQTSGADRTVTEARS